MNQEATMDSKRQLLTWYNKTASLKTCTTKLIPTTTMSNIPTIKSISIIPNFTKTSVSESGSESFQKRTSTTRSAKRTWTQTRTGYIRTQVRLASRWFTTRRSTHREQVTLSWSTGVCFICSLAPIRIVERMICTNSILKQSSGTRSSKLREIVTSTTKWTSWTTKSIREAHAQAIEASQWMSRPISATPTSLRQAARWGW